MSDTHDVTISGFDLDRLESELAEAKNQRDRLAVICGELIAAVRVNSMRDTFRGATHNQVEEWLKQWVDRLAAVKGVKGGNDE
jgi:hydrogenase maturation factor